MKCVICNKYDAVMKNFRGQGQKSLECLWCSGLSDDAIAKIKNNDADPIDLYTLDLSMMSTNDLENLKEDLYNIMLEKRGSEENLNLLLECERALILREEQPN